MREEERGGVRKAGGRQTDRQTDRHRQEGLYVTGEWILAPDDVTIKVLVLRGAGKRSFVEMIMMSLER